MSCVRVYKYIHICEYNNNRYFIGSIVERDVKGIKDKNNLIHEEVPKKSVQNALEKRSPK